VSPTARTLVHVTLGWRSGLDLDWAFDLVSADPQVREAALRRHVALQNRHADALRRVAELCTRTGTPWPTEPHLAADMDQRLSAVGDLGQYLLLTTVTEWTRTTEDRLLPYALLYLEWEAGYPQEWVKDWRLKAKVLRGFARLPEHPTWLAGRLRTLVVSAVLTTRGCENRWYVPLARAVGDPGLRARLRAIEETEDSPEARVKAQYLGHMLDHPALPATVSTWRDWLRT
jgi:hypothetical protein